MFRLHIFISCFESLPWSRYPFGLYCHVSGVPWLITMGSGLDLLPHSLHFLLITVNDCLRLVPFLTELWVSSLPLWLTWFWFTNRSLLSYERRMPNDGSLANESVLVCMAEMLVACSYPWKPLLIPLTRKTRSVPCRFPRIRISIETCVNEPLSSNGLFRLSGVMSQYCRICFDIVLSVILWSLLYVNLFCFAIIAF
jgi:hypothetical protein